jgi:kynurenine formamidase
VPHIACGDSTVRDFAIVTTTSTPVNQPALTNTLIDLSVTVSERLPGVWPSHRPFAREVTKTRPPYFTEALQIDEHTGTHFDAPAHFVEALPDARSTYGDRVDLRQLCGTCVVVPVPSDAGSAEPGRSPEITPQLIEAWEAAHGRLNPGEIVLLHSGWDRYYVEGPDGSRYVDNVLVSKDQPGWPAPDVPAMELLHQRGIRCVGTDAPSMGSSHDGAPVHLWGLSRGMLYIEGLTNLDRLPARGATFVFLPLKIEGSSGGPGRAVAWV